jgi:hypothetical protein
VPRHVYWGFVVGFLMIAYAMLFMVFGGSLRWSGFNDVGGQRFQSSELFTATGNPLIGYFLTLTLFAVNPLVIAYGLWTKRRSIVVLGIAGQAFLYTIAAARTGLVGIGLIVFAFLGLRYGRGMATFIIRGMTVVILTLVLLATAVPSSQSQIEWMLYRTWVSPVINGGMFFDFFSDHPRTRFSHVTGLGWVGENPYNQAQLGLVIGKAYGNAEHEANTHFWADGYASAGLPGMLIVTILAGAALIVLDSATRRLDQGLATLAVVTHAANLVHLPIFTALVSGGLAFSILLLFALPRRSPADGNL